MQQLLSSFKSVSILGPLVALMFLLEFSQNTISAVLFFVATIFIYKRAVLSGVVFLTIALLLMQGIKAPVLYYPVIMSFVVFSVFFVSIFSSKCLIQRFAEKIESADLPEHAISYCYQVNIIWIVFLAINTTISYLTITNIKLWSWYNGVISYLLIALLLVCEYVYRLYYRKRFD